MSGVKIAMSKDKKKQRKAGNGAAGLDSSREKEIGQHIGYRYDVNMVPDYERLTPYLLAYMEFMGWDDLNWLEDVHMGFEAGEPAIFDRNINGWVRIPKSMKLPGKEGLNIRLCQIAASWAGSPGRSSATAQGRW